MKQYADYVERGGDSRLALFFGASCPPCARLKPLLAKACADHAVELEQFDLACEMAAARGLGLRAVPSVVLITDTTEQVLFTGAKSAEELDALLSNLKGSMA